ncbi:hypothetical protein EDD86DRAFT_177735, partial [Gorgonomyces haynaldii]
LLKRFIALKLSWNKHQISLLGFGNSVRWLQRPTSDPQELYSALDRIEFDSTGTLDFGEILDLLPDGSRVILIYQQSDHVPVLCQPITYTSRNITVDVLYLHEQPQPENHVQHTFDLLSTLVTPESKSFELIKSEKRACLALMELLANAKQRQQSNHKWFV